ncbi:12290_t:CDS:2, partial [Racocetra persica]
VALAIHPPLMEVGVFWLFRINKGIYNRFNGSLQSLRNMNDLESLNIENTDIDHGLEYLPLKKLNDFRYSFDKRLNSHKDLENSQQQLSQANEETANKQLEIEIEKQHSQDLNNWYRRLLADNDTEYRDKLGNEVLQLNQQNQQQTAEIENFANSLELNQQLTGKIIEKQAQEIVSLRSKDLTSQIVSKASELKRLISAIKNKVGAGFAKTIDLLLNAQIAIIKEGENSVFNQGQLAACRSILEGQLTDEEIQLLLNKQ